MSEILGPDGRAFADWFTGELCCPQGKMVKYVHMGYFSKYESYLILDIVEGHLTGTRVINHDEREKEHRAEFQIKLKAERRSRYSNMWQQFIKRLRSLLDWWSA